MNCGAEDLKGILRRIADQIADADKRHSDALTEMRSRIGQLGERTETAKADSPIGYAAAFERIEDRLGSLADRLAESQRSRAESRSEPGFHPSMPFADAPTPPPAAVAGMTTPPALKSAFAAMAAQPAGPARFAPASPDAPAPRHEHPALKSQVSAAALSAVQSSSPAQVKPVQPAAAAQPHVPTGLEPWDADQAQALSEVYAELSGAPLAATPKKPQSDAERTAEAAERAVERAADLAIEKAFGKSTEAARGERVWLEARFGDIAKRIERSLGETQPSEGSLQALGRRFDDFEARLDGLLRQIAARGDKDALASIDAHVSDIANHLGEIETQLGRLDKVERNLAQVAGKLGNEAAPTETVLMAVAAAAADKALSATRHGSASEASQQRLEHLQTLVESYLSESREGDGHTASILESMQGSLNRLVERLDGLEARDTPVGSAPQPHAETGRHGPGAAAYSMGPSEHHAAPTRPARPPESPIDEAARPSILADQAPAMRRMAAELGRTIPEASGHGHGPAIAERAPAGREDFIAAARRAARQAASQPAAVATRPEPVEPPADAKRGLFAFLKPNPADAAAAAGKPGKPTTSKPVMVVAIVALLLASGAMLYGKLTGRGGPQPGHIEQGSAAPATAVPVKALQPTSGFGTIPGPGEAATAQPAAVQPNEPAEAMSGEVDDDETEPGAEPAQGAAQAPPASPAAGQKGAAAGSASTARQPVDGEVDEEPAGVQATTLPAQPRGSTGPAPGRPMSQLQQGPADGVGVNRTATAPVPLGIAISDAAGARPAAQPGRGPAGVPQLANPAFTTGSIAPSPPKGDPAAASALQMLDATELPPAMIGPLSMRLAAQKGDPAAEFEVASRYAQGNGIPRDFTRAAQWYARAASHGFAPAQYRLGTLYERGLGVPNDTAQARIWYRQAAEAGNTKSMHNLAVLSAQRDAGSPDYATAANWFTEAAERGLSDSQFNLGILYENGLGVTRSIVQSYKWFALAAAQGDKEAARRRDQVHGRLQAADRSVAEDLVRNWRAKPAVAAANDARVAGNAFKLQQQAKTASAKDVKPLLAPSPVTVPDIRN